MTKQLVLVGTLLGALAGVAHAQTTPAAATPTRRNTASQSDSRTTPKTQPETAPAPALPTGELALGSVHLPKGVKADGKALPAGTYQVKLTSQSAGAEAKGATAEAERWVEFMKGGKVVGREVATIVTQSEIDLVERDSPPPRNGWKVEMLKGGDYLRLWISRGGNHYLVHFPV